MADHQRYHLTFDVLRSRKNTCIVMGVLENVQDQVMVQRDTSSRCGVETKYGCPKWNLALTWTLHGSVAYKRNLRGGPDPVYLYCGQRTFREGAIFQAQVQQLCLQNSEAEAVLALFYRSCDFVAKCYFTGVADG